MTDSVVLWSLIACVAGGAIGSWGTHGGLWKGAVSVGAGVMLAMLAVLLFPAADPLSTMAVYALAIIAAAMAMKLSPLQIAAVLMLSAIGASAAGFLAQSLQAA